MGPREKCVCQNETHRMTLKKELESPPRQKRSRNVWMVDCCEVQWGLGVGKLKKGVL